MYVLGIDTATNSAGVALSRGRRIVSRSFFVDPGRCSDCLIDAIDKLLQKGRIALRDIQCLAVAVGPGSFTGLRVGLATVKAFGQALGIPAVGLSTLELLAHRLGPMGCPVCPMIDARRNQVFSALYQGKGKQRQRLTREVVVEPGPWLKQMAEKEVVFTGDGAGLYETLIRAGSQGWRVLQTDNRVLDSLCRLGHQAFGRGEATSVETLRAFYVRPSDAELGRSGP